MEKEEVMKMVYSLQRRIWNCGEIVWAESTLGGFGGGAGVVVVDFGTDWAMDESWSWRGQRSWLSLRSSWVKSLSAELTLPGRANHGCEAWRVTGRW
jgi:hypothetical protein